MIVDIWNVKSSAHFRQFHLLREENTYAQAGKWMKLHIAAPERIPARKPVSLRCAHVGKSTSYAVPCRESTPSTTLRPTNNVLHAPQKQLFSRRTEDIVHRPRCGAWSGLPARNHAGCQLTNKCTPPKNKHPCWNPLRMTWHAIPFTSRGANPKRPPFSLCTSFPAASTFIFLPELPFSAQINTVQDLVGSGSGPKVLYFIFRASHEIPNPDGLNWTQTYWDERKPSIPLHHRRR